MIFLVLVLVCSLVFVPEARAQDLKVDHVAGFFEKIVEKTNLFLKFKPQAKAEYLRYLTEKRLAELQYVIDSQKYDLIEPVSSRYTTYTNLLVEMIVKNKLASEKDTVIDMSKRHIEVVLKLESKFKHDSGWWLALQWNVDNLNSIPQRLKFKKIKLSGPQ